jgi:hypothetical protein
LPAAPGDRPAAVQQESVARIQLLGGRKAESCLSAEGHAAEQPTVGDNEQQAPVAVARRTQDSKVGVEADQAGRVAGDELQIGDPGVGFSLRIDREFGDRTDPLIRSGAEYPAALVGSDDGVA